MKHRINTKGENSGLGLVLSAVVVLVVLGVSLYFINSALGLGLSMFKCESYNPLMSCSDVRPAMGIKISFLDCFNEKNEKIVVGENCYLNILGGSKSDNNGTTPGSQILPGDPDSKSSDQLFYKNVGNDATATGIRPISKWNNVIHNCHQVRDNVGVEINGLNPDGKVIFYGNMTDVEHCELRINWMDESNNPSYADESKKIATGTKNAKGECSISGPVYFKRTNDIAFNKEVWESKLPFASCSNYAQPERRDKDAMFMLLMKGWNGNSDDKSQYIRTFVDVPEILEDEITTPETFDSISFNIESRPVLGVNGMGTVCDIYCKARKTDDSRDYPCEFVGISLKKSSEKCPNNLISLTNPEQYESYYDSFIFAENGQVQNDGVYSSPITESKICIMGFAPATKSIFVESHLSCSKIYYVNPEKSSPSNTCDIAECDAISRAGGNTMYEQICNSVHSQITSEHLGYNFVDPTKAEIYNNYFINSPPYSSADSFCSSTNPQYQCYSDKRSGDSDENYDCVPCAQATQTNLNCKIYARKNACIQNPCLPGANCYWEREDKEEKGFLTNYCSTCPQNKDDCDRLSNEYQCDQCSICEWNNSEEECEAQENE